LLFFFFFSSRRRHTRFSRDWSSDVCSSDLAWPRRRSTALGPYRSSSTGSTSLLLILSGTLRMVIDRFLKSSTVCSIEPLRDCCRSEERRVGKECRYRWWPDL